MFELRLIRAYDLDMLLFLKQTSYCVFTVISFTLMGDSRDGISSLSKHASCYADGHSSVLGVCLVLESWFDFKFLRLSDLSK